eukprot:jgi/Galph1/1667/GphlegSOOS_G337.1
MNLPAFCFEPLLERRYLYQHAHRVVNTTQWIKQRSVSFVRTPRVDTRWTCLFGSSKSKERELGTSDLDDTVQQGWSQPIQEFYHWLKENGVYISQKASWSRAPHRLLIAEETSDEGEASGRGLLASRPINLGEKLFEIPEKLILSRKLALQTFPESVMSHIQDEYISIALLLLFECAKGEDSFFKPYLNVLPTLDQLNPLFLWNERDLSLLKGSPSLSLCYQLREKLQREYEWLEQHIFPILQGDAYWHYFSQKDFLWAFAILFSRAVCFPKSKHIALVPYADLLNHNCFCSAFIDEEDVSFSRGRLKEAVVYADRSYQPYEQVYVSYGPRSNQELLLLYGFSLERNPFDCVEISIGLDPQDPSVHKKREILESCGKTSEQVFPLYADRYAVEMIEFLRFCCAEESELEADFGKIVSQRNEESARERLINYLVSQLNAYDTTIEEDEQLIRNRSMFQKLEKNQRMAIRQRLGEKRILRSTWKNLQSRIYL